LTFQLKTPRRSASRHACVVAHPARKSCETRHTRDHRATVWPQLSPRPRMHAQERTSVHVEHEHRALHARIAERRIHCRLHRDLSHVQVPHLRPRLHEHRAAQTVRGGSIGMSTCATHQLSAARVLVHRRGALLRWRHWRAAQLSRGAAAALNIVVPPATPPRWSPKFARPQPTIEQRHGSSSNLSVVSQHGTAEQPQLRLGR
jgi:hypothetical protein